MTSSTRDPYRDGADKTPDDTSNATPKQKLAEDVRDAKHEAGAKAREKAEAGQHRVAEGADALSDAIDAAASNLDDNDRQGLARYARELSSNLSSAAGQLEGRSVDQLANDAKRLARNNPAMFMLGSVAVGFGLSRFFKASAEHDHHKPETSQTNEASTGMPVPPIDRGMTETYSTSTVPHNGDGRGIL